MPEPIFFFPPYRVPEGEYFMMGDNRDHSSDSRFWGTVPYSNIVGKPWFIYFSWESRTYNDIIKGFNSGNLDLSDQEELKTLCQGLNVNSAECKDKWDKDMAYKIRWDRVGNVIDK
jgi:signal peptidase I